MYLRRHCVRTLFRFVLSPKSKGNLNLVVTVHLEQQSLHTISKSIDSVYQSITTHFPKMISIHWLIISLSIIGRCAAFTPSKTNLHIPLTLKAEAGTSSSTSLTKIPGKRATDEWEIDCYSRPVMIEGKKLWEVLITDSSGSFRMIETLPSNK